MENAQHFSRLNDDSVAVTAGIAGRVQGAVLSQLDRRSAPEVEVPPPPAHQLVPALLEPTELGRGETALAEDLPSLQMHPRPPARGADLHPLRRDAEGER